MKTVVTISSASILLLAARHAVEGFAYIDPSNGSIPGVSKKTGKIEKEQHQGTVLPPSSDTQQQLIQQHAAAELREGAVLPPGCDPQLLQEHAQFACKLADAARLEILPYWRQSRHTLGQEIKVEKDRSIFQSASPVTLADRAAERAMRELITEKYPQHGVYGEEYGVIREDADWVWGE